MSDTNTCETHPGVPPGKSVCYKDIESQLAQAREEIATIKNDLRLTQDAHIEALGERDQAREEIEDLKDDVKARKAAYDGLKAKLSNAEEEIGRLLKIQSVGEYQKNLDEIEALRLSLHQMDEINANLEAKLSKAWEEIASCKDPVMTHAEKISYWENQHKIALAKLSKPEEEIGRLKMTFRPTCTHLDAHKVVCCAICYDDNLKQLQQSWAKLSKLERVRAAAKSIADNCPYNLDEASVPKDRNLELPQVVGNWSVAWLRRKELIAALRETEER